MLDVQILNLKRLFLSLTTMYVTLPNLIPISKFLFLQKANEMHNQFRHPCIKILLKLEGHTETTVYIFVTLEVFLKIFFSKYVILSGSLTLR